MTTPNPGGLTPGQWGVTGTDGSIPAKSGQTQDAVQTNLQNNFSSDQFAGLGGALIAMILSFIAAAVASVLGGFLSVIDAIFGTVNNEYVEDLPIIQDHSHTLTTLVAQFNQLILQGNAIVFTSNNTYVPTDDVLWVEFIIIGAGAGGGAGRWDLIADQRGGGGGGGGGGEVHVKVPSALLPTSGGHFSGIQILVGAGGSGGTSSGNAGSGGGNTSVGPISGSPWLIGGGGNGGAGGGTPGGRVGGPGGTGMIPGGTGGTGGLGLASNPSTAGGNSVSAYSLNGGGGGGGGGGSDNGNIGSAGGAGGISAGGTVANPGGAGTAPSSIVATGGGGGAGALDGANNGGAGAYPAGGGGGGSGTLSSNGNGANAGNGVVFVVEHFA